MYIRTMLRALTLASPFVLSAVAFAAEAADAHGDDHGGGGGAEVVGINPVQFLITILVFGIAFFVLAKTAWPKILTGLEDREEKIRADIFAAEEAKERANEAMAEYEKSLAQARAEANEMIEKTRAEQSRMAATLRTEAEAELNELRDDARRNIEAAKRAALAELYTEAANLSTAVAQRILEREVNVDDQRRLVEEAVSEFTSDFAKAEAAS